MRRNTLDGWGGGGGGGGGGECHSFTAMHGENGYMEILIKSTGQVMSVVVITHVLVSAEMHFRYSMLC